MPTHFTPAGDGLRMSPLFVKPVCEMVLFDKASGEWTFHRDIDGKVTHRVRRFRGVKVAQTR
jgi:hypothetical protein